MNITNSLLQELKVTIYESYTEILASNDLIISFTESNNDAKNFGFPFQNNRDFGFLLFLNDGKIVTLAITDSFDSSHITYDQLIYLDFPLKAEKDDYIAYLNNEMHLAGQPYAVKLKNSVFPEDTEQIVSSTFSTIFFILERFGFPLTRLKKSDEKTNKPKTVKPRHKWTKEVSQIEFSVDRLGAEAKVYWIKRNEMLIKSGAKMMPKAPLNKDNSLGFSARFGEQLRQEHHNQFQDFITTEDIYLKSVNEVGLFLYFGGTNSWLELLDEGGKSINEWTIVN